MTSTPATSTTANRAEPADLAAARLRYASDDEPGIRRIRRGRGFSSVDPDGSTVDPAIPAASRDGRLEHEWDRHRAGRHLDRLERTVLAVLAPGRA